jgi:ABC-2 type transport system ATP-binding protein
MIEAQALTKKFNDFTAVEDLSLDVGSGMLLALLGPNGAGKTTTVRMLSAILKPTRGTACINGYDVLSQPDDVRRSVGVLTEQPGLYTRSSGLEYLLFFGRLYGMDDQAIRQRSLELFERFGMPEMAQRRLGEYSKGMRQKVGLIRAMLHSPAVLLLDEPTSAMDPHSAKLVRDAILELRRDRRTIVLCTHNLNEAEMLADRIAIIRRGRIVALGTPAELKARLLGDPLLELRLAQPLDGLLSDLEDMLSIEAYGDTWLRYRTSEPEHINPRLLQRLAERGTPVVTLSEVPRSLEEVYLRIVNE